MVCHNCMPILLFMLSLFCFGGLALGQNTEAPHRQAVDQATPTSYIILLLESRANTSLAAWSVGSMIVGGIQLFSPNPFTKAFGLQNLVWGSIDGGIAYYGHRKLVTTNWTLADKQAERLKFRKILLINTLLDFGYLGLGLALYRARNSKWHGHGAGVMLQGGFLLLFDAINLVATF